MCKLQRDLGEDFVIAHTSGHAIVDDLKLLVDSMKPRVVIPIHTEHGDEFAQHFPNTVRLQDGEQYSPYNADEMNELFAEDLSE